MRKTLTLFSVGLIATSALAIDSITSVFTALTENAAGLQAMPQSCSRDTLSQMASKY
jgi:hypothetical protein